MYLPNIPNRLIIQFIFQTFSYYGTFSERIVNRAGMLKIYEYNTREIEFVYIYDQ